MTEDIRDNDRGWRHDRLVDERFRLGAMIAVVVVMSVAIGLAAANSDLKWVVGGFAGLLVFVAAFLRPDWALLVATVGAPLMMFGGRIRYGFGPDSYKYIENLTLIPGTGITPLNALMVLLVIGAWLHRMSPSEPANEATEVDKPLLIFLGWSALSVLTATVFWNFDSQSVGEWLQFAVGIATYWVVRRRWSSKTVALVAVWLVLALVLYQSWAVYMQYKGSHTTAFDWDLKRLITGTFPVGNSNDTGTYLSCYGLVGLGLFMVLRRSLWRWPALLVTAASVAAMFMTYSRAAMFGMIAGGLCMTLYKQRKYLVPLLVVMAILPSVLPGAIAERFSDTNDASAQSRTDLWKQATVVTLKNPVFGLGWRAYSKEKANEGAPLRDPHNMYLLVSSEQGIPGIVLFLGIMIGAGKLLTRTLRRKQEPMTEALALGLFGALICFAVNNMFGSRMIFFYVIQHFFLLLGLVVVLSKARPGEEEVLVEVEEPQPVTAGQPSPWRYRSYV